MKVTLEDYLVKPLFRRGTMSTPMALLQKGVATGHNSMNKQRPETAALQFYLGNHIFGLIRARYHPCEVLPVDVAALVQTYIAQSSKNVVRLFYYLLSICTRESRHACITDALVELYKNTNPAIVFFHKSIKGNGSDGAFAKLLEVPIDCTVVEYTQFLVDVFYAAHYSSGYGGDAWADVAKALNEYTQGRTSAEVLIDTGWTLAHNNGPIFNKGIFYDMYTPALQTILDVQRAGRIPELVHDVGVTGLSYLNNAFIEQVMLKFLSDARMHFGMQLGDYVDWAEVEALGALGSYGSYLSIQQTLYGPSLLAAAAEEQEKKKQYLQAQQVLEQKKHLYQVDAGTWVNKIVIKRAEEPA